MPIHLPGARGRDQRVVEPALIVLLGALLAVGLAGSAALQAAIVDRGRTQQAQVLAESYDRAAVEVQRTEVLRHEVLTGDARGDRLELELARAEAAVAAAVEVPDATHPEDGVQTAALMADYAELAVDPDQDAAGDRTFDALFGHLLAESVSHHAAVDQLQSSVTRRLSLMRTGSLVLLLLAAAVGLFGARSIAARRRELERLATERERDARQDVLTGLPNRAALTAELIAAVCADRPAQPAPAELAVLWLDLDGFKAVNDTLGHATGDQLLRMVAERLRRAVRPVDTVSRFGGDEFVVLCPALPSGEVAEQLAGRVVTALRQPFQTPSGSHVLTASVGVAVQAEVAHAHDPDRCADALLSAADTAMYRAKALGRGQVARYDRTMRDGEVERLQLAQELAGAVDDGQLLLHLQPQVDVRSGVPVGVEALVRWQHPRDGLLQPATFIALAEQTGHVVAIGEWVLGEACRTLAGWQRSHDPALQDLRISVNVSARQLLTAGFTSVVERALADSGADPDGLCLEVTESVVMDVPAAVPVLQQVRRLGVHLSLDDFGTGYSSLGYLKDLPVHEVKLDRSFVSGLGSDARNTSIVAAMVALCGTLGLELVAEGVETERQRALLQQLGCAVGQGYLWSRPAPVPEVEAWLRRHRGALPGPATDHGVAPAVAS